MKIAELKAHYDALTDSEGTIETMVDNHEFPAVFSVCIESFPHIVPAINYSRKGTSPRRRSIFWQSPRYASTRRRCLNTRQSNHWRSSSGLREFWRLSEKGFQRPVEAAQKREQLAHAIWNHLERQPGRCNATFARISG